MTEGPCTSCKYCSEGRCMKILDRIAYCLVYLPENCKEYES